VKLIFSEHAWEDYLYWQRTDRKILQRINTLIKETQRTPFEGIGKPEPLKHGLSGYWSLISEKMTNQLGDSLM
jgi:toxin YoeB